MDKSKTTSVKIANQEKNVFYVKELQNQLNAKVVILDIPSSVRHARIEKLKGLMRVKRAEMHISEAMSI